MVKGLRKMEKTYSLLAKDVNGNRLLILLEACLQCLDNKAL